MSSTSSSRPPFCRIDLILDQRFGPEYAEVVRTWNLLVGDIQRNSLAVGGIQRGAGAGDSKGKETYQNAVKRFSARVEQVEEGARRVEQVSKDDGASCCPPPQEDEQSSPGRTRIPCRDSQSTLVSLEDSQLTVSSADEAADGADVECDEEDSSRKKGEKRVVFP